MFFKIVPIKKLNISFGFNPFELVAKFDKPIKLLGEIDFVIQNGMGTELVEVKSGNDYKTHSALNKIRNTEGWKFRKASVFCKGNVELENGVLYYPWYMILFAKPFQAPKEMKYEIDLSALK